MRKRASFLYFDKLLFITPILVFTIGIASIYSASFKSAQSFDQLLAVRQILWMGIGALMVFLLVRVDYLRFLDLAWPAYALCIFLLGVVLLMPAKLGAHRWIPIGGINFQPSELAKICVIMALSHFFANNRYEFASPFKRLVPFVIVGVPFLLILKEPDLGTSLTLWPPLFAMLYLWGYRARTLIGMVVAALVASPFCFGLLKEYQKARLLVFVNPDMDPLGAGYTIIQSKIAIGSGGLLGKGFLGGTQNQLQFLPERHTDFIFSVIAEEGGFLGALTVLALFWIIVQKGYSICSKTSERFGSQLACGITTMIGVQTLINIGMSMGLLPVVGMPLPLVSYGGSSVVMMMLAIGLLINIKMYRHTLH